MNSEAIVAWRLRGRGSALPFGLLLALSASALSGCEQSDDVVASSLMLGDAGAALPPAMPEPDAGEARCETSQLYVLFSSIVRNQCLLPSNPASLAVLGSFFVQNPPPNTPAEARPPSTCDILSRFSWLYDTDGAGTLALCPAHCEFAKQYVDAEEPRLLECQGFGGDGP